MLDNYATPKTVAVVRWLARHPRWHLHFIPTHSFWLNQVERFFAELTGKRLQRESFTSVAQLRSAILDYLKTHNTNPRPFKWTASADLILGKLAHLCRNFGDGILEHFKKVVAALPAWTSHAATSEL